LDYAKAWQTGDDRPDPGDYPPRYQPKVQPALAVTLGPDGVGRLVKDYLAAGMTAKQLAVKYGYGVTTIKRVLREQGARRRPHSRDTTPGPTQLGAYHSL
jgi:hypothetical protein